MAETSYPWVGAFIATDPTWENLFGHLPYGVKVTQSGDDLAGTIGPGVTDFTIGTGGAMLAGRHYDSGTGATVAIPNAGAGAARTDRVVLECDRNNPGVGAIKVVRLAGTPGAGAPSIFSPPTGKTYLPLYAVTRTTGSTTIVAGNVVDERWKLTGIGFSCSSTLRPPPFEGQIIREYDTGAVKVCTGGGAYVNLLNAGSRAQMVPGGFQQYTGGLVASTAKGGALYDNLKAGTLGGVFIPNELNHVYHVEARALLTQTDGNVWGRLMLLSDEGGFMRLGKPAAAQDTDGGNRPVAMDDMAELSAHLRGSGGPAYAVKLGVQKIGGAWNWEVGSNANTPAEFVVTDLGLV